MAMETFNWEKGKWAGTFQSEIWGVINLVFHEGKLLEFFFPLASFKSALFVIMAVTAFHSQNSSVTLRDGHGHRFIFQIAIRFFLVYYVHAVFPLFSPFLTL